MARYAYKKKDQAIITQGRSLKKMIFLYQTFTYIEDEVLKKSSLAKCIFLQGYRAVGA